MHGKLSITVLLRAPVKTAITLVLLLATSFAFISRGAEYATTVAEIDRVEAQYSAVGTLQRSTEGYYEYMENLLGEEVYELENGAYIDRLSNATAPLDAEVVDLILNSEYLADSEFFMVAGGLTHEYENILEQPLYDVPNYSEWDWISTEGTFEMDAALVETTYYATPYVPITAAGDSVTKVVIGDSSIYREGQIADVLRDAHAMSDATNDALRAHKHERKYLQLITSVAGGSLFHKQYVPYVDYPVLDLTALEEEYGVTDYWEVLKNPEKYGVAEYQNFYGFEAVPVLEYIETLYRNFHTQELVHISGMDALHKYHSGELYITDGRGIDADDAGLVCVVSSEYAAQNALTVGDTIEFELSADTMQHSGKVFGREPPYSVTIYERTHNKWTAEIAELASEQQLTERGLDTVTQTYEIVGVWSDSDYDVADPFSYSPNTVFVPASTYPWAGEVEPTMLPSTLSFTLNHPGDMAKIEAELGGTLAALGYELSIDDMGYAEAKPNFEFMKLSALISFAAMSLALLLSLALVVYLFILRRRRDYAIMRALGMPERQANNTLLIGLLALSAIAVMFAGLMSLVVTQNFSAELAAQLSEITGVETVTTLPSWLVGVFAAGVLILLTLFARIGLIKVGRTPPLGLLQGGR